MIDGHTNILFYQNNMSKPDSSSGEVRKLHILALHGYRQNAETFRQKTGSFRKLVQKWAYFTYVTAPHRVTVVCDNKDTTSTQLEETGDVGMFVRNKCWLLLLVGCRSVRLVFQSRRHDVSRHEKRRICDRF